MIYDKEQNAEFFPEEDYESLRKGNKTGSTFDTTLPSDPVINYKPVRAPAWGKHSTDLPPKPARFSKLTNWDKRCEKFQTVVTWVVVAAGAASIAGPAIMHIPH